MRALLIVGNWKMNGSFGLIEEVHRSLSPPIEKGNCEIVICPPNVLLLPTRTVFKGSGVFIGAQNVHTETEGAFTGEISASLLKECGVQWCIVGHSERRMLFGETDDMISSKVEVLLSYGIRPIICIGETLQQRQSHNFEEVVLKQLRIGLSKISTEMISRCVVAYEPVWAIGTGMVAEPKQVNSMLKIIRNELVSLSNEELAEKVQILYGGSVDPENVGNLISMEEVDGALVGGASLNPEKFKKIIYS